MEDNQKDVNQGSKRNSQSTWKVNRKISIQ